MVFINECVRLVSIRKFTSKAGKDVTFLNIADPATYENGEFMPIRGMDVSTLEAGKDYKAVLHVDARYNNIELLPLKG